MKATTNEKKAAEQEELNPRSIFTLTWNELLVKVAKGEIDAKELAKQSLKKGYENREKRGETPAEDRHESTPRAYGKFSI